MAGVIAGVMESLNRHAKNVVIDTEEQEACQKKTSEISTAEVRKDQVRSAPSLPYSRNVKQVQGRPLSLCNLRFFAYEH